MLQKIFDASEVEEFGKSLAEEFARTYSILDKKNETEKTSLKKRAKLLDRLTMDVRKFGQQHSLNFYKKAKLGNTFKWSLLEKGFDSKFVDDLVKEIILALK